MLTGDTFALMFSYPLMTGRDCGGLGASPSCSFRCHFGHKLDSSQANPRRPGHALACVFCGCHAASVRIIRKQAQQTEQCSLQNGRHPVTWWGFMPLGPLLLRLRRPMLWRRPSQIKPKVNKRMLINDLISVPHHTADDKFGDGRLGGTSCGFPPLFGAVRRRRGGIKAEQSCYQGSAEELSEIKEEVVKVVKGNRVLPWNPPHTHTHTSTVTHFLRSV